MKRILDSFFLAFMSNANENFAFEGIWNDGRNRKKRVKKV